MNTAPLPPNEQHRLDALYALRILDTPPEERFDRITRLAQQLLNTPIVLISLVDADRQWFKSRQGLEATETSREVSFCAHAILDFPATLVVSDTWQDERFSHNRLVTGDPKIRFYAGRPVAAPDGSPLGTLCVIDRQPRQFSEHELTLLEDLATLAENEINLMALAQQQTAYEEKLKAEAERSAERADFSGQLLKNVPVGVVVVDTTGRFVQVNQAFADMVGYNPAELTTKNFRDFSPPDRLQADTSFCKIAFSGQNTGRYETERLHKNGRRVPVQVNATPLKDKTGVVSGLLASVEDITEYKQAEAKLQASERRFRAIFNQTFQFIGLLEPDGTLLEANRAALEFGGLQLADVAQRPFWEARWWRNSREARDKLRAAIARAAKGEFVRYPVDVLGDEDQVITIDFSLKPVFNELGEVVLLVPEGRDITEQKRAEQEIYALNRKLEQRVAERTAELSQANVELAHANRLKDEFLAAMSHELRTPLNAILGFSESLQAGVFGDLNSEQVEIVADIAGSGQHLLDLITDILELSKIEAGKLEAYVTPVQVKEVCQAGIRLIHPQASQKELKVITTFDEAVSTIFTDERLLKQILVNLLNNAVKFTPAGGRVGLEVIGDEAETQVLFTVWDTGIGIAPENRERLFQPFVQLDSRLSRQYEGAGLGLSLVYRLAKILGGAISVESELGHGSRFTVSLPWERSQ